LEEALALLREHGDDAKVLSGGHSLLPLLKLRLGAAGHLIDIGRIPGLEYIREESSSPTSSARNIRSWPTPRR
jgi:carbon-monoxide dehydrogenase medium subunit